MICVNTCTRSTQQASEQQTGDAAYEHLKDKDPSYYYSDVLIPNGKTLKDFIGG